MELKYKKLSLIGKIWVIAELYNAGIRDDKQSYVSAAIRKLEQLQSEEATLNSCAIKENTLLNILNQITGETSEFVHDHSAVSFLWYNRAWLDDIKNRIRDNQIEESDMAILEDIYREIKLLWFRDLRAKKYSSEERLELYKIYEETKNLKNKIHDRVVKNQIDII